VSVDPANGVHLVMPLRLSEKPRQQPRSHATDRRWQRRLGEGLAWRAMTDKTPDELVNEYETAARRCSVLQRHWEQMILVEPLRPGEEAPTITREQINLEDEIRRAWDDYVAKRNAYLAATGLAEPA
jgi:hypothetical protein